MKILFWNVRGAGKPAFHSTFRRLLQVQQPDICILAETRLSGVTLSRARRRLPAGWGFYAVESVGLSGGIIVIWRPGCATIDAFHRCSQQIALVVSEEGCRPWLLSGVYASTDYRQRRLLWRELSSLLGVGIPAMIIGDFNCIDSAAAKRGGKPFVVSPGSRDLRSFLDDSGLQDLGFVGARFTWCNNRSGGARVWERIDRAFATPSWLQAFPSNQVRHLPRIASDHSPLLVFTAPSFSVRSPFRFEKFWLAYPRSWEIVREVWRLPVRGDSMYRISRRLELVRRRLRRWNRDVVGDISRRLEEAEAAISELQLREDSGPGLSESDMATLRAQLATHHSLLSQQETMWRQKSRVRWLADGDRNTRFFHQATIIRRHRNQVRAITDSSGQQLEDDQGIRDAFFQFFRSRWTATAGTGGSFSPPPPIRVSEAENGMLCAAVRPDEVRQVLWSIAEDAAPGPDGFPPVFFRRYWPIIRDEVVAAVQGFFSGGWMLEGWKQTFITLIPKRPDASEPGHFRPISLCSTLYKLCAKLLVCRLKPLLPRLIRPEQGAFIAGRNISDNILLAQEFLHDLRRAPARRSLMAIKLDMERAYDRMSWQFLEASLLSFGFHRQWVDWILACVCHPSFAVLVNGAPSDFFRSSIGLRQGCPLSPFLFIICSDSLSRALHSASLGPELDPYTPAAGAQPLSHLLFADDCLLMARATPRSATRLREILEDYCQASGQRVNLRKSAVFLSPKLPSRRRLLIREILGIAEQLGPCRYLGVPLSGRRPSVADFAELEQAIRARVEGWQSRALSMMGRITLIRSVLASMPVFLLANSVVPVSSLRRLEQRIRGFLWRSGPGAPGVHLLSWEVICQPVEEGGLGIQSLVVRREALIARHAARFLLQPDSLWSAVMRARYGSWQRGSDIRAQRGCSFMWREICARGPAVRAHLRWSIGDGRSTDLLEDSWLSDLPLARWPTFVSSEVQAATRVHHLFSGGRSGWDRVTVRRLFGAPLGDRILSLPVPVCSSPDRWVWRSSGSQHPRAADLYSLFSQGTSRRLELRWIWRLQIHPRIRLFLWKVAWGRLPTRALLSRRGLALPPSCPFCSLQEESVEHMLFLCPRSRRVWRLLGPAVHAGVRAGSSQAFLEFLRRSSPSAHSRRVGVLAAYTAYHLWLSRNAFVFDARSTPDRVLLARASAQAAEFTHAAASMVALRMSGLWVSPSAPVALGPTLVSWEPPPPLFLKVNFDGSARGDRSGAGFVIRGPDSRLMVAGGCHLFGASALEAELQAAWFGISLACRRFHASRLCIEGDSAVVIGWIRQCCEGTPHLPLLVDIRHLLMACSAVVIRAVFREANSAADWVASYVADHSGDVLWTYSRGVPGPLSDILLSDLSGCIHVRSG